MTFGDQNPLANPLNRQTLNAVQRGFGFTKDRNAKLPEGPSFADMMAVQAGLHVPETGYQKPCLDYSSYGGTWRREDDWAMPRRESQIGLNAAEIARDEMLRQKEAEMLASMSDEQKQLSAMVDRMLPKSRLVDEQ